MSVVLISGPSTGIGRATAIHFARLKHDIHSAVRNLATATGLDADDRAGEALDPASHDRCRRRCLGQTAASPKSSRDPDASTCSSTTPGSAAAARSKRCTIKEQIAEPLRLHEGLRGRSLTRRVVELLTLLRIPAPERRLASYPHQFSGGMRQRVVGAIALSCSPQVLIADEPTTSLDVTIQASFLALLKDIQRRTELSILFITHDFGVVARMCDRVAVMYAGRIVETAPTWELFDHPAHPYTEALLGSVPDVRLGAKRLVSIEGSPPSIYAPGPGCPFAPRCHSVMPRCHVEFPPEREVANDHRTSCWKHA